MPAAQPIPQVTPSVQIPVISIINQALWRDSSFSELVGSTAVVKNLQLLPLKQSRNRLLEVLEICRPGGNLQDAYSALDLGIVFMGTIQQLLQPLGNRCDKFIQPAGLHIGQQLVRGQERVREPLALVSMERMKREERRKKCRDKRQRQGREDQCAWDSALSARATS